jgi:hypothetical protein
MVVVAGHYIVKTCKGLKKVKISGADKKILMMK